MNGYTLASSYNGCIGEYPISQILNIDSNINTSIYSGNEICFSNLNYFNTKIDNQGILRFFHNQTEFLPTVLSQWISVPDAIVYLLQASLFLFLIFVFLLPCNLRSCLYFIAI